MREQFDCVTRMERLFEDQKKQEGFKLTLAEERDKYPGLHGTHTCHHCMTDIFNVYFYCPGCEKQHNVFYSMCPDCFVEQYQKNAVLPVDLTDYGEERPYSVQHTVHADVPDPSDNLGGGGGAQRGASSSGVGVSHKEYICGFRLYTKKEWETQFSQVLDQCKEAFGKLQAEE